MVEANTVVPRLGVGWTTVLVAPQWGRYCHPGRAWRVQASGAGIWPERSVMISV